MKKTKYLLLVLLSLVLSSCYKDLSTEASIMIPDIIITGVPETLDVVYGDQIKIPAKAYMGEKSGDDMTYLWEIDITANRKERVVIGEESTLTYTVANSPANLPYLLTVRVTDPETGLQAIRSCFLTVRSALGEGLLVAYTLPDGQSSEVDIIASPAVTYGYEGTPRVTRKLYSLANGGAPYPERITCMLSTVETAGQTYNTRRILIGSTNHVVAIDPLTFEQGEEDAKLFNSTTMEKFGPSIMFNGLGYSSFMFIDADPYGHLCNIDNVFAKMPNSIENPLRCYPHNVSYTAPYDGLVCVYNDNDGIYCLYLLTVMAGGFSKLDTSGMLDFPLDGSKCLQGGALRGTRNGFLVQDRDGAYHIVVIVKGNTSNTAFSVPVDGENLENMVSGAFFDNGDLFYYATERDIYATIISGNTSVVRKLSWKPDNPGERITNIRQYTQAWYGTCQLSAADYGFVLPTHRNILIITTYDESKGEGKIYLRGINVSTGLFTFNGDYGSFSGFGEITAIAPTLR
ncbi:MAG: hypothetical protein J5533_01620 [Bacteroidales bacterium]|nr:hypothetical protein [Bacteroidales bacterium]